ncbi:pyridoxamine 5'-phosphate oxidase family protein [Actinoplanes sp. NPDC049265]|uniref:pyridoxamine 5'-phosphate oxidase family protein n=1 Tax=Actinoplanes sp. NPDC049265 TaxID=3363902 RepID=UPI0037229F15
MTEAPRPAVVRKKDALHRLENDQDLWAATASRDGVPTLVPLSFHWDGSTLLVATIPSNPTGRNILDTGVIKVALGHTRDVVLIDGAARILDNADVGADRTSAYETKNKWNPAESSTYRFFLITPASIESWRELNEHGDRALMRDGTWLV